MSNSTTSLPVLYEPGLSDPLFGETADVLVLTGGGIATEDPTAPEASVVPGTTTGTSGTQDSAPATTFSAMNFSMSPSAMSAPAAAANSTSYNAIVLENMKQGTPQSVWDLSGPGSSNIEGFTTDISYNLGQTVSFKINTDSSDYRIEIYRLGYYGGDGARLMGTLDHEAPATLQPDPIRDLDTGLVDAGNWSVTDTWNVPLDAVSGIYIAKLVREDGTFGENQIPFIVRNDASTSDIVFQTADSTWQAYNGWGGANLYGGNGPGADSAPGRSYAVSYNRPITTRDYGGTYAGPQDYIFGAEYSALYWLEANGYDVTYISGVDTARYGENLLNHKVFMDVGHDEYWSAEQRANVEAARDAGVSLAFLSGNSVYWKTRWEASIDGSETDYRTMVSYKETRAGSKIDPSDEWTGTWRDLSYDPAAGGHTPENALQGTQFSVDSYRLDTITIPYEMTQLRFWRNTAVAETAPGETAQLVQNLLGYEWDSAPDNSFTPDGLIRLSATAVAVDSLLYDYGTSVGPGIATHNLTMYRAESGAIVFGAGTVYWSWGLADNHDLEATPTDANVQQAMVNLFADMGVQAQTLQAGLLPAAASVDFTAPTSTINVVNGAVSEGQRVTLTGHTADIGGVVAGVEVSTDGGSSWWAATSFDAAAGTWSYTWTAPSAGTYQLMARSVDDSLNMGFASAAQTVTVGEAAHVRLFSATDTPPPLPQDWDPSQVAVCCNVCIVHVFGPAEVGVKFTSERSGTVSSIMFYKDERNTGPHVAHLWAADGTLLATANFTNESASGWQQVNFSQPVTIAAGMVYIASYSTTDGIYLASHGTYFAEAHTSGPLTALRSDWQTGPNGVIGTAGSMPGGPVQSSMNYWVDVMFDPASTNGNTGPTAVADGGITGERDQAFGIAAATLTANDTDPNGDPLSILSVSGATHGTASWDYYRQVITFTPDAGYVGEASFTYTVTDGRGGTSQAVTTITVEEPPYRVSLFQESDAPQFVSVADNSAVELGVRFTASVAGTVTGIRFYKGSLNTGTHTAHLWNANGSLLATATFSAESASGWQQVNFTSPVTLVAGQTYVASYHTTSGMYSATPFYFDNGYSAGVLSVAADASGLFAYGASGSFPNQTYQSTNYWVDVLFAPASLENVGPVATADSGFIVARDGTLVIAASALLANDTDANGDPLTITGVSGAVHGTAVYDAQTGLVTFTPDAGYEGAASFTYAISDGHGGTSQAQVGLQVQDLPDVSNLFGTATPAVASAADGSAVELGMRFHVTSNGNVAGVRFYKGAQNTGTHTGSLWTADGTLLATATFSSETSSGWQEVYFAAPVTLVTGQTYVVSYHTNAGYYSVTPGYFQSGYSQGAISAEGGANGVFAYGGGGFPTQSYNATNYWVDVLFDAGNTAPQAEDDTGLTVQAGTPLVITLAMLMANDRDANGDAMTITGISNVLGGTAVLDSQAGTITFTPGAGYAGAASFDYTLADASGDTDQASVGLTVVDPDSHRTLFSGTDLPAVSNVQDNSAVALGVRFTAEVGGQITGIRFYKGAQNTGTHTGSLWTSGGTLLGTVTFSNETASGWQEASFSSAIDIVAGQTYVASYHTTSGYYSATSGYFNTPHDAGVLASTGNASGVYGYGSSAAFPYQSYNATNYWVDVVMDARNRDPLAADDTGLSTSFGSPLVIPVATLLGNDVDPDGDAFTLTGVSGATHGSVAYDAQAQTVTFTPQAGYSGAAGFSYEVTDARGGTSTASVGLSVGAQATTTSLFNPTDVPAIAAVNDPSSLELGMRFSADEDGLITGIRFYKGAQNTGEHTGSLWTASGTLLATATFSNETTSGWQQVNFATPVAITANTDYVASYHTNTGFYSATGGFFAQPHENGPLNAASGNNGLFAYGTTSQFPTGSWNSTNYWVDVAFQGQLAA